MASIFTRIVQGEIPSYKLAEDDNYYAFLDINPLQKGHVLVIPKQETDYIFDLEETVLSGLFVFAQWVAKAIKATIPVSCIGLLVCSMIGLWKFFRHRMASR